MDEPDPVYDLSQNEARVLHSLVKWPEETDQAIHSQINMKKSTFSSIKTRLKDQGYYERYYVPNFPKIGFELFMVMFGQLNRFTTIEERMRIAEDTIQGFVEDFHVVSESNRAFNLSISQNYTEYSRNIDQFFKLYSENKFLSKEGMHIKAFPFALSRIYAFADYESLLAKLFGFKSEMYENRMIIPSGSVKKVKLTKAERKVLVGLVKYPDETDTLIADEVGVSRNTVANAKRKFIKNKVCFPRLIPNISKLGFDTLVFQYRKFNPKITPEDRKEATEKVRELLSPHFYVSKNLDGFLISAHRDEETFDEAFEELTDYYNRKEYILEDPIVYKIDISNMHEIKTVNFLPMVMKSLEFDPNIPIVDQN